MDLVDTQIEHSNCSAIKRRRLFVYIGRLKQTTFVLTCTALNNWYHIVGTYDGANLKIYLNGVLKVSNGEQYDVKDSNEPVDIGAS
jgi:hypothetical protein